MSAADSPTTKSSVATYLTTIAVGARPDEMVRLSGVFVGGRTDVLVIWEKMC